MATYIGDFVLIHQPSYHLRATDTVKESPNHQLEPDSDLCTRSIIGQPARSPTCLDGARSGDGSCRIQRVPCCRSQQGPGSPSKSAAHPRRRNWNAATARRIAHDAIDLPHPVAPKMMQRLGTHSANDHQLGPCLNTGFSLALQSTQLQL